MTEPNETPGTHDMPPGADPGGSDGPKPTGATAFFESLRDAIDDLTVRATPAVREVSARAAELTAVAAAKAAPIARKAGDATSDASGRLAERSRIWAAEMRSTIAGEPGGSTATATAEAPAPPAAPETTPTAAPETNGASTHDAPETPPS
jgi:hypothetical protein